MFIPCFLHFVYLSPPFLQNETKQILQQDTCVLKYPEIVRSHHKISVAGSRRKTFWSRTKMIVSHFQP